MSKTIRPNSHKIKPSQHNAQKVSEPFAIVPHALFADTRLTAGDKLVAATLTFWTRPMSPSTWASREAIGKRAGLSPTSVTRSLAKLQKYEWIVRHEDKSVSTQRRTVIMWHPAATAFLKEMGCPPVGTKEEDTEEEERAGKTGGEETAFEPDDRHQDEPYLEDYLPDGEDDEPEPSGESDRPLGGPVDDPVARSEPDPRDSHHPGDRAARKPPWQFESEPTVKGEVRRLLRSEREGGWYERCTIDELEPILEPLERGRRPKVPSTVRPEPFAGPELDLKVLELGHLRRQVRRRDEIDASILSGIERARAAGARVGELEQALGSPSWVEPGRFYEDVLWELGDWLQRDPRATAVGAARVVKRVADRYQIPGRNLPLPALTRAEHDERRPWNPGRWPR